MNFSLLSPITYDWKFAVRIVLNLKSLCALQIGSYIEKNHRKMNTMLKFIFFDKSVPVLTDFVFYTTRRQGLQKINCFTINCFNCP